MAFVVVLAITLLAVVATVALERRSVREALQGDAGIAAQATRGAVEDKLSALRGIPGLVRSDGTIARGDFNRFARALLRDRSITGITYAVRLTDAGRSTFERRTGIRTKDARADGSHRRALRRNAYVVTVDVAPRRYAGVLGLDVLGDPARATAVRAARDGGGSRVSRPVELVVVRTPGLIAYKPLYRGAVPPPTRAERRIAFTGVVGATFEASALERQVLGQLPEGAELRILDRRARVSGPRKPLDGGEAVTLPIAGRRWTVEVAGTAQVSPWMPLAVGALGLLTLLLVDSRLRQLSALRRASSEQRRLAAEREVALAQSRFLAESGALLDASLDTRETLQQLADLSVPTLADWCVVALARGGGWEAVAVSHHDPALAATVAAVHDRHPPDRSAPYGTGRVLVTGEPELHREMTAEVLQAVAQDAEHLAALQSLGMTSAMVVPLVARGRILGAMTLASASADRLFGEEDLDFAVQLARRAALSADNAELHGRTVRTARTLQAGLLPAALPRIPDVELAARYHPVGEDMEVGGDFYDVHALESGGWGVTVGDVCGKGAEAAALTALIRYTLRAVAEDGPTAALRRLNEAVLNQRPEGTFATLVHLQAIPQGDDLLLRAACAGHPPPVVRRASGALELLSGRGPLIGAFGGLRWDEEDTILRPGDALALYTDGVLEAGDRPMSAEDLLERLRDAAPGAEGLASAIEAVALSAPRAGRDDVAVLVLERRPAAVGERHELPADSLAPGRARQLLEPHLERLAPDRREAARLLVTETVTNAVRHGTPPHAPVLLIVSDLPGGVRVEVRDQGAGMRSVPPAPQPGATGGYGLQLVQELSDRWGWSGSAGTAVWFELDAPPGEPGGPDAASRPVGAA